MEVAMKSKIIFLTGFNILVFLLLTSLCTGEVQWFEEGPSWYSNDDCFTTAVTFADIDQDGDLDLITGNYRYYYHFNENDPSNELPGASIGGGISAYKNYLNETDHILDPEPTDFGLENPYVGNAQLCVEDISLEDFDGDGYPDLAIGMLASRGYNDGGVLVFKNAGESAAWETIFNNDNIGLNSVVLEGTENGSYDCACVRWVDFDCDGDLDLAALETFGRLHLYQYDNNIWNALQIIDFSTRLNNNPSGQGTDDFSVMDTEMDLGGTTMEFGDINQDGWPDLFLNVDKPDRSFGLHSAKPVVFLNTKSGDYFDPSVSINHKEYPDITNGMEGVYRASFGRWDQNGQTYQIALAVAGKSQFVYEQNINRQLYENAGLDPSGVNIYTFCEENNDLQNRWSSRFDYEGNPQAENKSRQYYTDIQWAYLEGPGDNQPDLIACSYPFAYPNYGEFDWVKGREHAFTDPTPDIHSVPDWTTTYYPDLSTSLALGDIGGSGIVSSEEVFNVNDLGFDQNGGLFHLKYQPIQKVQYVEYSPDGIDYTVLNQIYYCYSLKEGWVSIKRSACPQALYFKIGYNCSTELDLAVGNDGKNALYQYNATSVVSGFTAADFTLDEGTPSTEYVYQDDITGDDDLMDESAPLGVTFQMYHKKSEISDYLKDYPDIHLVGVFANWPVVETMRGHYFWNRVDKQINAIYENQDSPKTIYIATHHTPTWTMGDYMPGAQLINEEDPGKRTVDERIQVYYIRNLVNRYRPGGYASQAYSWVSGFGIKLFQSENEPNICTWGYSWLGFDDVNNPPQWSTMTMPTRNDPIVEAIAEKMYRTYQIIKEISQDAYGDQNELKLISPNFGCWPGGNPEYAHPPLPYLHALNDVNLDLIPGDEDHVLWKDCDFLCQQLYCTSNGLADPFLYSFIPNHNNLHLGIEDYFWSYYTDGLSFSEYQMPTGQDWTAVMDEDHEKPFFVMEWSCIEPDGTDRLDYAASQIAEMFSVDVYPSDVRDLRLLQYNAPFNPWWVEKEADGRLMNTMSKLLTGTTFYSYIYPTTQPPDDYLYQIVYWHDYVPPTHDDLYIDILRTNQAPIETQKIVFLHQGSLTTESRVPVYDVEGNYMDRRITNSWDTPTISFAANELRPDEVLLVSEDPLTSSGGYSQAIQLERGWNLVSWYVELPDPTPPPQNFNLYMNDIFCINGVSGDYIWLNPFPDPQNQNVGDRVGRYNSRPTQPMYPTYTTPETWTWSMNQAYPIYRDRYDASSPAYFWEYTNQPHCPTGPLTVDPDSAWSSLSPPNFWWFLAYPLRMEQKIDVDGDGWSDNPTISYLENYSQNLLVVLKDDDGHQYVPGVPHSTNLYYLTPGKGYFAGFLRDDPIPDCPGFSGEVEPASLPGGGAKGGVTLDHQTASEAPSHFTYTERTYWWYPIVIDTALIGEIVPEAGDEIGVFDGDLCVGAAMYQDSFPVILPAWKDDIVSAEIDGYEDGNEMIFKWYDCSENQEITFEPPPGTYAAEDDRIAPTHSGFGAGFYARRSLTDGVQSIIQLPKEFNVSQNYPNPFNPTTVIPFELPQRSRVTIDIFDVSGRLVWTIEAGVRNAGRANVHFNASRLASGVYFYRVTAEGLERGGKYQDVGKMLLLK